VFGLDEHEEKWNYIFVLWKLEMHGNEMTSYVMECQVDDWKMSLWTLCL